MKQLVKSWWGRYWFFLGLVWCLVFLTNKFFWCDGNIWTRGNVVWICFSYVSLKLLWCLWFEPILLLFMYGLFCWLCVVCLMFVVWTYIISICLWFEPILFLFSWMIKLIWFTTIKLCRICTLMDFSCHVWWMLYDPNH